MTALREISATSVATIPSQSYHDYTFNTSHNPKKNTITTNTTHLKPLDSPTTTTSSTTSQNAANIWGTSLTPTTLKSRPMISKHSPKYSSDSSRDDDSFLYTKEERQSNLPFGDLITNSKETKPTRLLFQNFNSLEISLGHHTLELLCDSIGQYEVDISCLIETNTHWKYLQGKVLLNTTTKKTLATFSYNNF